MRSHLSRLNDYFRVHAATWACESMQSTSTSLSESHHIDQLVPFKKSTLHRGVDVATNDGDCDQLVQDAGELVAAAHVTDWHEVGTDHAGQLGGWLRLEDHAQAAQSIMPAAVMTAWSAYIGARP